MNHLFPFAVPREPDQCSAVRVPESVIPKYIYPCKQVIIWFGISPKTAKWKLDRHWILPKSPLEQQKKIVLILWVGYVSGFKVNRLARSNLIEIYLNIWFWKRTEKSNGTWTFLHSDMQFDYLEYDFTALVWMRFGSNRPRFAHECTRSFFGVHEACTYYRGSRKLRPPQTTRLFVKIILLSTTSYVVDCFLSNFCEFYTPGVSFSKAG